MFSKILLKLVDEALIPAIVLVAVRFLSIVVVGNHFNLDFTIGPTGFVYRNTAQYVLVNTYSLLSMALIIAIGLIYVLIKAHLFHETHISPRDTARLFSLKLSSFIQSSFDIYTQGAIWISYSYLLMFVLALMSLFKLVHSGVFFFSLVVSILSTIMFVIDIERELFSEAEEEEKQISEKNITEKDDGDYILTLGEIEL